MRAGLWSLSPVPGAGIFTRFDEYSEARQYPLGIATVEVAVNPAQVNPAWNSSSAVSPPRFTAGCPPPRMEVGPQALFGSFDSGLKHGTEPATCPESYRQLKPPHRPVNSLPWESVYCTCVSWL